MGFVHKFGRLAAVAALMVGVGLAGACNDSDSQQATDQTASDQPPAQIDLPSAPPAEAFNIAETNDDGTLRVAGLIHYQNKHLKKKVRVKGIITDELGDCDPKRAAQTDETCPKPHYVIRDKQGAEKRLLVVGFDREFFDKADAAVGDKTTFEGTYKKVAQGFVSSGDGLVVLDKVGDVSVFDDK